MDQKKDDDKKPAIPIPTLKDSKTAPQLKIKGLAQGGLSLLERMKQFKKKDLAFILAGLGVLFLAPLAEHFMMAPEGDAGSLQGGFGGRGDGSGIFGKGGSPYEPGVNGLAPGGLAGGGSDVITPLNVRDPAALVMGPGAQQQAPATSAPAPAAPSKPESNDWKDALAQSAAKAAGAAAPKAALPVPKIPLSAGGLRGLGAVSGGGGGSYSLPALSAAGVPNRGNVGSSPSPTGGGGIRGVGARGEGQGGNPSNLDALKKAAQNAANVFNGPGSASSNLETAAKTQFGDGSGGGGAGEGGGAGDKASGQSGDKGSKNADGQSLAFLKAKQEQEKAIEFEWKKKEAGDLDLMWFKLRDKMAEEALMTPFKAITGLIAKQITNFGTNSGTMLTCFPSSSVKDGKVDIGSAGGSIQISKDDISPCGQQNPPMQSSDKPQNSYSSDNNVNVFVGPGCSSNAMQYYCTGAPANNNNTPAPGNGYTPGGGNNGVMGSSDLQAVCNAAGTLTSSQAGRKGDSDITGAAAALGPIAARLVEVDGALNTGSGALSCGSQTMNPVTNASGGQPIKSYLGLTADYSQPDGSNKAGNWALLNDVQAKLLAMSQRDKSATDAVAGVAAQGQSATPLFQSLENIRGKVKPATGDGQDVGADDADVKAVTGMKTTVAGIMNKQGTVDDDVATKVPGELNTVQANLKLMQAALADAQGRLSGLDSQLRAAQPKIDALNASNPDMGKSMSTYLTNLGKTKDDLNGKVNSAISEYNRQANATDGVYVQETALQRGLLQFDASVRSNLVTGQGGDGRDLPKTDGAAFPLPKLADSVGAGVKGQKAAGPSGTPAAQDTDFKTKTNLDPATQIKNTPAPFATDISNENNAAGPIAAGAPPVLGGFSMQSINKKVSGAATDANSPISPAPGGAATR